MKILVLGTGAKDTAIAWWFSKSMQTEALYMAPGNPGVKDFAINLDNVDITSGSSVYQAVVEHSIDLVFIGTEDPLIHGVADYLKKKKVQVCGAPLKSFKLDLDRIYARNFAEKYGIPFPEYNVFNNVGALKDFLYSGGEQSASKEEQTLQKGAQSASENTQSATKSAQSAQKKDKSKTYVLKPNTMTHSRDISISGNNEKIIKYAEAHLNNDKIILEEYISGLPITFTAFIDENGVFGLPLCSEYTKRKHSATEVVTGGMGSVCPVPLEREIIGEIQERIVEPTLNGLKKEKILFKGIITFSMILKDNVPYLVDYHLRLNDPATQCIATIVKNDLCNIMKAMLDGKLSELKLETNGKSSVGTVIASLGYPYEPQIKCRMEDIPGSLTLSTNYSDCYTFLGAVKEEDGALITTGGRVATVVGVADNIINASKLTYQNIDSIRFNGAWYRKDIGEKFFKEYLESNADNL